MNVLRAVTAGLIGGFIVDLYLVVSGQVPFPGVYQFIASTLVGPAAFASPSFIALGVVMHFTISVIFALAYAAIAERNRALAEHPTAWGSIFGLAVFAVMQVVLALAHAAKPPTPTGIVLGIISHVIFFGLPVAWYVALGSKRRSLAA